MFALLQNMYFMTSKPDLNTKRTRMYGKHHEVRYVGAALRTLFLGVRYLISTADGIKEVDILFPVPILE
jgi:hypothetical protein